MFPFVVTAMGSADTVEFAEDVDASAGSGSNAGAVLELDSSGRESLDVLRFGAETSTVVLAVGAFAPGVEGGVAGAGTFLASRLGLEIVIG
jgi:hypothetical protein